VHDKQHWNISYGRFRLCSTDCIDAFQERIEQDASFASTKFRKKSAPSFNQFPANLPSNLCKYHYDGRCNFTDERCPYLHVHKAQLMAPSALEAAVKAASEKYRFKTPCKHQFAAVNNVAFAEERDTVACTVAGCQFGHDVRQFLNRYPVFQRCAGSASCKRLITRHRNIRVCTLCRTRASSSSSVGIEATEVERADKYSSDGTSGSESAPKSAVSDPPEDEWFDAAVHRIRCRTCADVLPTAQRSEDAIKRLASTHKWDADVIERAGKNVHELKAEHHIGAADNSHICLDCGAMISSESVFLGHLPSLLHAKAYWLKVHIRLQGLGGGRSSESSDSLVTKEHKSHSLQDAHDYAITSFEDTRRAGTFAKDRSGLPLAEVTEEDEQLEHASSQVVFRMKTVYQKKARPRYNLFVLGLRLPVVGTPGCDVTAAERNAQQQLLSALRTKFKCTATVESMDTVAQKLASDDDHSDEYHEEEVSEPESGSRHERGGSVSVSRTWSSTGDPDSERGSDEDSELSTQDKPRRKKKPNKRETTKEIRKAKKAAKQQSSAAAASESVMPAQVHLHDLPIAVVVQNTDVDGIRAFVQERVKVSDRPPLHNPEREHTGSRCNSAYSRSCSDVLFVVGSFADENRGCPEVAWTDGTVAAVTD
jgi:hypothetical protein